MIVILRPKMTENDEYLVNKYLEKCLFIMYTVCCLNKCFCLYFCTWKKELFKKHH